MAEQSSDQESQLRDVFHISQSGFACGGSLKVADPPGKPNNGSSDESLAISPITIRWDGSSVEKITLPVTDTETSASQLNALLATCAPASFGHNGKDVLDETYRKATKLDDDQFSSSFHPHDCGIVDAIAQSLLPLVFDTDSESQPIQSGVVTARLYKLNVYSAPLGKFKTHVDTPRGPRQFGSLVVCLPCEHEGKSCSPLRW